MRRISLAAVATLLAFSVAVPGQPPSGERLPDWSDYLGKMQPIGERVLPLTQNPDDPRDRQETWRLLMANLAQGYAALVYGDPDYPEFTPTFSTALNIAAPNPDYLYKTAFIRGDGVYRIRGNRGTNLFTTIQIMPGYYALGTGAASLASHEIDELHIAKDGSFEVILSKSRPPKYSGDWWPLDPRAFSIGLRVAAYDWLRERDGQFAIERLDAPASSPRLTAEELSRRMSLLATWVEKGSSIWWQRVEQIKREGVINRVKVHDWGNFGGALGQVYYEGLYDLQPDEVLVLEAKVPDKCKYWSFVVGDEQFVTVDWMNHQSSLNGYQAHVDPDGIFRGVISVVDPGVPNWLDTGGHQRGFIQVRWNNCSAAPEPVARKLRRAELRRYLPASTPVVSPEERDAALRERRMGAQMRRRW